MMLHIVEFHSYTSNSYKSENWTYQARDLALCRVTQLLIAHPACDLSNITKDGNVIYTLKLDTRR